MSDKYLRNGWKVRFLSPDQPENNIGHVHGVGYAGFSVRYEDGMSIAYQWRDQEVFSVLSQGPKGDTHDSIAQELLLNANSRDAVEDLLLRYRIMLGEDLDEIADDIATSSRYRIGMHRAAERLRKAGDL